MKLKGMLRYTVRGWGMLVYISVVFCLVVFWMAYNDHNYHKENLDEMIAEHGSVELVLAEDAHALDGLEVNNTQAFIMMGAGLFGGSVGLIFEMFGIAMQFGIARRTLKRAYLFLCLFYSMFISGAMYLNQFAIKAWLTSRCTGVYEVLRPAYEEGIDTSLGMLGSFIMFSIPVMFAGSSLWLIMTRFRKSIGFFIGLIVCIFAIVFGIVMAVVYKHTSLIYVILAAGAVAFLILLLWLISTQTVEHQATT